MGGEAFTMAQPSLRPGESAPALPKILTPRMRPDLYDTQKAHYVRLLQQYLPDMQVLVPHEVPEKKDFGDIDILIFTDDDNARVDWLHLAKHLAAHGYIKHTSHSYTLAVPYADSRVPSDLPSNPIKYSEPKAKTSPADTTPTTSTPSSRSASPLPAVHATQIDLHLHTNPSLAPWTTFHASYGDIAGILGQSIHWLGLTLSNTGLYLRSRTLDILKNEAVYDFESTDPTSSTTAGLNLNSFNIPDAAGRILLSTSPEKVLEFFGMSFEEWESGFKTKEELYVWMGENRFLGVGAWRVKRERSKIRRRVAMRGVFREFYFGWLPGKLKMEEKTEYEGEGTKKDGEEEEDEIWAIGQTDDSAEGIAARQAIEKKRIDLADEAAKFFGKENEYQEMEAGLKKKANNVIVGQILGAMFAESEDGSRMAAKGVTEVVRAFRRLMGVRDGEGGRMELYIREVPNTDEETELGLMLGEGRELREPEKVALFVGENWEEVRSRERERVKAVTGRRGR